MEASILTVPAGHRYNDRTGRVPRHRNRPTVLQNRGNAETLGRSMFRWLTRPAVLGGRIAAVAILAVMLTGCGGGQEGKQITVFAASSLTEAFTELAAGFQEENPESTVALNFDGSQRLRFQLEHGAEADVFASADQRQMDLAQDSGVLAGEAVNFASNRLVIIAPKPGATVDVPSVQSVADLSGKGVKLALAQEEVPAGRYAREVIGRMTADPILGPGYADSVLANVATEEPNVRNVLQKVALGEVDAGFVYYSDARVASDVSVISVPAEAAVAAVYTIAVLDNSNSPEAAKDFIDYVMSGDGQDILRRHGFEPPAQEGAARLSPLSGHGTDGGPR